MARFEGNFFNPQAPMMVRNMVQDIRDQIAREAYDRIQVILPARQVHDTGRNASMVRITNATSDMSLVQNTNAVYGPWIEGTGSRNRTTRFKGYGVFRQVASAMQPLGEQIARAGADRIAGRLNG